jgi:hypothetical protein
MKKNILKVPINIVLLAALGIMIINEHYPDKVSLSCFVIIMICFFTDIGYQVYHYFKKRKQKVDKINSQK